MGRDGSNGGLVVLNTQASSQNVLKALAWNSRAVQAIIGGQQRKGVKEDYGSLGELSGNFFVLGEGIIYKI